MNGTPLTDKRCEESQKLQSMAMRFAWMCDHARRLERDSAALRAALEFIAEHGGEHVETECGTIACTGSWCAEQARAALAKGGEK